MTWDMRIHDVEEYRKRQASVDYWMLRLASAEAGTCSWEVGKKLFALGIGDAVRDTQLGIAYSSTGVIVRTAKMMLQKQGLLVPWMLSPIGRIAITPAGRAKLEEMKGES